MLNQEQRIRAFVQLGQLMHFWGNRQEWPGFECGLTREEYEAVPDIFPIARQFNPWFTPDNVEKAMRSLGDSMSESELTKWVGEYTFGSRSVTVGLIMAGNIPLVGFHDVMCVLLSGHKAKLKFSSDDNKLFPLLLQVLVKLEPQFAGYIDTTDGKLEGFDAVLATGSNNTSRYFEHYFGHVPHIIRRNRHSAAVLTGAESDEELRALGHDIFDYFGLGCRSVSKLYLPNGYNFNTFFGAIFEFGDIVNHHKYANNYDYNKAVWLLNKEDLLDNGFVLLRKSTDMTSPTGSLHYEFYDSLDQVHADLQARKEEIQCVVGEGFVPFGKSQSPRLNDYADSVDTMDWLAQLSRN